jgi:aspartate/methionine/tyrosine aminotransferase
MNNKLININENLKLLNDYPFQRLNSLLKDIKAPTGRKEIILSIGEPKHTPPQFIKNIINKNYSSWGKYPPTLGMEKLNIASINWLNRRFKLPKNFLDYKENILQLAGTREGLFNVALALNPSKKNKKKPVMLIPEPFYQVYAGACRISGAEPFFVPSIKENGFIPSFASVDKKILMRTSIIYVCSPSNPEGTALNINQWENLISLARKYNAILIVDECYTDIYINDPPIGILEACQKLNTGLSNIISFHSLSKRSNVPGIRSGFAVGDKHLIQNFKKLRHYCAGQQPIPIQEVATALWNDDEHSKKNREIYNKKFKLAKEIFKNHKDFYIPDGGFYLWLKVGNGEKITRILWKEKKIKVMPGAYLSKLSSSKAYIRIALISNIKETKAALKDISSLLSKHQK